MSGVQEGLRREWADRFAQQAVACAELGSALYGRLLALIGSDVAAGGSSWDVIADHAELRYGQAGPLRLVGAAHRLALAGEAPEWASLLASCGGVAPTDDDTLFVVWLRLIAQQSDALRAGLDREVQTNEVARAAGLALASASTGYAAARLVEIGCSGGLNLRLDKFCIELDGDGQSHALGDPTSAVRLAPRVEGSLDPRALSLPVVTERIGIDPHPVDVGTDEGRLTLLGFVWSDQAARFERIAAAIDLARTVPADLRRSDDTAGTLEAVLSAGGGGDGDGDGATIIQQSIMWQYVPTDMRWRITEVIESAAAGATVDAPLAWIRFEPDEWDRRRASIWLRTWPDGGDRLVAHVDYHGRWIAPMSI